MKKYILLIILAWFLVSALSAQEVYLCDPPASDPAPSNLELPSDLTYAIDTSNMGKWFEGRVLVSEVVPDSSDKVCWVAFANVYAYNPISDVRVLTVDSLYTGNLYDSTTINFSIVDSSVYWLGPTHFQYFDYCWSDSSCCDTNSYVRADWLDGLTSADVRVLYNHLTGATPFTEFRQYIAADVNMDGAVDAVDLEILNNFVIDATVDSLPDVLEELLDGPGLVCYDSLGTPSKLELKSIDVGTSPFVFISQWWYNDIQTYLTSGGFTAEEWKDIFNLVYNDDCLPMNRYSEFLGFMQCDQSWYGNSNFVLAVRRGDVNFSYTQN